MRKLLLILALSGLVALVWIVFQQAWVYPETRLLPYYALQTLLRLGITYITCLTFGLVVGILAATRERIGNWLIPLLDILQSVPVLGFFPLALAIIIQAFHESTFGLELASMFLLFTSMEWSIVFGVITGIKSMPSYIVDMRRVFHIEGWDYVKHILLPSVYPYVVAGSMLAWGSGWYFVIITEFITFGDKVYSLPGLGYYLNKASFVYGSIWMSLAGLIVIGAIVFLMNRFIWHRLSERAGEYQFLALHGFRPREFKGESFRLKQVRYITSRLEVIHRVRLPFWHLVVSGVRRRWYIFTALGLVTLVAGVFYAWIKIPISPVELEHIATATAFSMSRLTVAYLVAVALAVGLGLLILRLPAIKNFILILADIMQSIPALAYFPILFTVFTKVFPERVGMEITAVFLMLTGMLWYLVFNVLETVEHWPKEINELAGLFDIRGTKYLRDMLVPGLFPALISGSILAWGGGWNATIVSEYVNIGHKEHVIPGLGSSLDLASNAGDTHELLVLLGVMVVIVVVLNHFVWRPLLNRASTHVLEET